MFQRVLLDFVLKTFGLWAENETRTRDPNLGKVVLYQLSYFRNTNILKFYDYNFPVASAKVRHFFLFCKFFTNFFWKIASFYMFIDILRLKTAHIAPKNTLHTATVSTYFKRLKVTIL